MYLQNHILYYIRFPEPLSEVRVHVHSLERPTHSVAAVTSNPLRFFSVIIHSPNFFSFFCQQKTEKTWLIVHNKRATTVNFKIYNHRSVTYIMESLRLCQGTAVCPEQILCNYIISIQSDILNQS